MSSNGAFSRQARKFFNDVKRHVQDQGRTHMGISFRDSYGSSSFTTRYWGNFWQQRLSCALTGTSASRALRMIATDRMQAARIATGGKDAHVVPRVYGRVGYDVPVAQSARAPSRRVWRVDFGVMEWGVMRAAIPLGCCDVRVVES